MVNSVQHNWSARLAEAFNRAAITSMDFFVEPDNIWVASSDGNLADVKKLISSGVDVNAQDEYGYSPL
jgi:ankyrin repeat protein